MKVMLKLSAAVVAVLLLVALAAPPFPADKAFGFTNGNPDSMAALGDSITKANNVDPTLGGDHPEYSWSTGTIAGVQSHHYRILQQNSNISGNNFNDAVSGSTMSNLNAQATTAVGQGVEYATILMGANDVCTTSEATMTSVATYASQFTTAMNTLTSGLPNARIFVASIPDIYHLWDILHTNSSAVSTWNLGICQSMLANPTSTAEADVTRRANVRQRNIDFNTQLATICAAYTQCRWDNLTGFNWQFAVSDVSTLDYFHPSIAGQTNAATRAWEVTYDFPFVVNSSNDADDGACNTTHCSLREAINAANAVTGLDLIYFNISGCPGGVCTITLASALPDVTGQVTIDGYTQPGALPNTNGSGTGLNTVLKIELNGTTASAAAGFQHGLLISAGSSTVRGLVINRFDGDGVKLMTSGGNVISGSFIGTDVSGSSDLGNGLHGVEILSPDNVIGGSAAGDSNVISGNTANGVLISGAATTGNVLLRNYIGTDGSGSAALANDANGVLVTSAATESIIAENTIAHNAGDGVFVLSGTDNWIGSNFIHSNGGLGIDLGTNGVTPNDANDPDTGANNLQNFPVLSSALCCGAGGTVVAGSLNSTAGTQFYIQFFANSACDASGNGEGQLYLGSTTVTTVGNDATIGLTLASTTPGDFITATATRSVAAQFTSEFSACRAVELDTDGDSVPDASDNCTAWANPSQALPAWVVAANDPDCDGFDTAVENGMTTNASLHCGANAWPPDFNDSMSVVLQDVLLLKPHFGSAPPDPDYSVRFDLNANSAIGLQDVLILKPFFGLNCG